MPSTLIPTPFAFSLSPISELLISTWELVPLTYTPYVEFPVINPDSILTVATPLTAIPCEFEEIP